MEALSNRLLDEIRRQGWTPRLVASFEREYSPVFCQCVALHMRRLGLIRNRFDPKSAHALSDRQLELFQSAVSGLWEELLGGLVDRYLTGIEQGKIEQEFVPYVSGVIRYIVLHTAQDLGLLAPETPVELIKAICRVKATSERQAHIAWAKYCLESRVKEELISRCPRQRYEILYRMVHRASDYIFEQFIPNRCERIIRDGSRALERLLEEFLYGEEFFEGIQYTGRVTPYRVRRTMEDAVYAEDLEATNDSDSADIAIAAEEAQPSVAAALLREERLALWDQLLRGGKPDPAEAELVLFPMARDAMEGEAVACAVVLAAVHLGYVSSPAMQRNLRAAVRYWFSRVGTKERPRGFNAKKDLERAGLVELMGLYLTWPEAMESVGGNPRDYTALQRVTEALREQYNRLWEKHFGGSPPGMPLGGDE